MTHIVGDENVLLIWHGKLEKWDQEVNKKMKDVLVDAGFTIESTEDKMWIYYRKEKK